MDTTTTSVVATELSQLEALTADQWGIIIMSLVSVFAVVFLIVQLKNVIKRM